MSDAVANGAVNGRLVLGQPYVLSILPHRDSKLFIREGATVDRTSRIGEAVLHVTEQDCEGHFPGQPLLRGVDILDATYQLLGLTTAACSGHQTKNGRAMGVGRIRWRQSAPPGTAVTLKVTVRKVKTLLGLTTIFGDGEARNDQGQVIGTFQGLEVSYVISDKGDAQ